VGAYGGKREILEKIAPQGSIYQAGTLSGNPIATAAGIATLLQLKTPGFYKALDKKADRLVSGLKKIIENSDIPAVAGRVGSMMGLFFTERPVTCFDDAKTFDSDMFSKFYAGMRDRGIYIAPSQFEVLFMSAAHEDEHIDATIAAAEEVFQGLGKGE